MISRLISRLLRSIKVHGFEVSDVWAEVSELVCDGWLLLPASVVHLSNHLTHGTRTAAPRHTEVVAHITLSIIHTLRPHTIYQNTAFYLAAQQTSLTGYSLCFACVNSILFLMISWRPIISGSTGPIFVIFSPNGRHLCVDDPSESLFDVMATNFRAKLANHTLFSTRYLVLKQTHCKMIMRPSRQIEKKIVKCRTLIEALFSSKHIW